MAAGKSFYRDAQPARKAPQPYDVNARAVTKSSSPL